MSTIQSTLNEARAVFPYIFANDFLRYLIGAGGVFMIVNFALARVLAGRRIRDRKIARAQIIRELLTSFRTVLVFSMVGMTIWVGNKFGFMRFYDDPAALGWVWFAISVGLIIILHDAWFYWTHRLIHDPRLFRRCHRTHHLSYNPTPFTAYAFDLEEAVINAVFVLVIGFILPLSFLAVFIFTAHMMLRNAIGHCGYELFPRNASGRPLFDWLTSVTHHDLHHSNAGYNYGLYFTFWDRVMGTEHPDYPEKFAEAVRRPLGRKERPGFGLAANVLVASVTLFGLGFAVTPLASAQEYPATFAEIEGLWATQGYGAVVSMTECAEDRGQLCGELVWAWDETEISRDKIGMQMISGLIWSDGRWRKGKLRNPVDGRTYRGNLQQVDRDRLKLQGCALIFCQTQTQTWRRLSSLPHITGELP